MAEIMRSKTTFRLVIPVFITRSSECAQDLVGGLLTKHFQNAFLLSEIQRKKKEKREK